MQKTFILTSKNKKPSKEKIKELSKKLPKEIAIFYSSQYAKIFPEIQKQLSSKHLILNTAQVLGCSNPKITPKVKTILLISDGVFHAINLAYSTKLKVIIFNGNEIKEITNQEIEKFKTSKKSSYVNFLNADKVGVLISTKSGQQRLDKALDFKTNKQKYFFLTNNINTQEFENFPQIKSWINTACPRLDMASSRIVNIEDLRKLI